MNPSDLSCNATIICWAVKNTGKQAAKGAFTDAASAMFSSFDGLMKDFLTSWLGKGVLVDLQGATVTWFTGSLATINLALVALGLIIAGGRTAYQARADPARQGLEKFLRFLIVAGVGSSAVQIFLAGGDGFSKWILQSAGSDPVSGAVAANFAAASPGLALIFGCIGIMIVGVQWGIMILRGAILPLVAAFWPTAAAAAMFEQGEQIFGKVTAWLLAFVLYSPLAAGIYAFAWRAKNGGDGVGGVITSLVLVVLAIIALPALMRLLVPQMERLGRAVGGAMALGAIAAGVQAGVAIGAAVASGGSSAAASAGTGAGTGVAETGTSTAGGTPPTVTGYGSDASPVQSASASPTADGGQHDPSGVTGTDAPAGEQGASNASGAAAATDAAGTPDSTDAADGAASTPPAASGAADAAGASGEGATADGSAPTAGSDPTPSGASGSDPGVAGGGQAATADGTSPAAAAPANGAGSSSPSAAPTNARRSDEWMRATSTAAGGAADAIRNTPKLAEGLIDE